MIVYGGTYKCCSEHFGYFTVFELVSLKSDGSMVIVVRKSDGIKRRVCGI